MSYMFLKVEFAFLDHEKSAAFIFTEYMAMMGIWVFIAFYVSKVLGDHQQQNLCESEAKGNEKNPCFSDGDDHDFFISSVWWLETNSILE